MKPFENELSLLWVAFSLFHLSLIPFHVGYKISSFAFHLHKILMYVTSLNSTLQSQLSRYRDKAIF